MNKLQLTTQFQVLDIYAANQIKGGGKERKKKKKKKRDNGGATGGTPPPIAYSDGGMLPFSIM